jgi:hypothetical protein
MNSKTKARRALRSNVSEIFLSSGHILPAQS